MVEEETRRYRPTKNYLDHLPSLNINAFETEVMKQEFERMHNRLPMEVLSMKRYELPPPPPGKMNDLAAWQQSVENSYAQLDHQATRYTLFIASSCSMSKNDKTVWNKREKVVELPLNSRKNGTFRV